VTSNDVVVGEMVNLRLRKDSFLPDRETDISTLGK
jgi:hypothetical protein